MINPIGILCLRLGVVQITKSVFVCCFLSFLRKLQKNMNHFGIFGVIPVFYKLQPIDQTVCNASPSSPWINVRTLLTCSHVPNTTFVPQIANLGFVTSRRTILQTRLIFMSLPLFSFVTIGNTT